MLDVRADGAATLVLLRQLPDAVAASTGLDDADTTALARLEQAIKDRTSPGTGTWPERCAGAIGED